MSDAGKNHPELEVGEVFLTNASDNDFPSLYSFLTGRAVENHSSWESIGWRTKRRGVVAYDSDGKSITEMFPVFVQRWELIKGGIDPDTIWD